MANASGASQIYGYNAVSGSFDLLTTFGASDSTQDVTWGDWDNDGEDELLTAQYGVNVVYDRSGSTLVPVFTTAENEASNVAKWVDWDDDGCLDVIVGNEGLPNRLYLQTIATTCNGQLAQAWVSNSTTNNGYPIHDLTREIAVGDFNGDGWPDLALANYIGHDLVFLNAQGDTPVSAYWADPVNSQSTGVDWGDFEGDGDLDLAFAYQEHARAARVFLTGATGIETTATWVASEVEANFAVAWGDWDGDGDEDLAVGNDWTASRLYENRTPDNDGDGWEEALDCDDTDATIHPTAVELCDLIDSNCNGSLVDNNDADTDGDGIPDCVDDDADNDGSPDDEDCAPADPTIGPNIPEIPDDGIDQDCNGFDTVSCHPDLDLDGWGDTPVILADDGACDAPGEVDDDTDCNDGDDTIYPGAPEVADNAIDEDCDGVDATVCSLDLDGDTYGGSSTALALDGDCTDPGEAPAFDDCDDADASIHPGALEIGDDGIDQDCDGLDLITCYPDVDGDGYGVGPATLVSAATCEDEALSTTDDDCGPAEPTIHPGAPEFCDAIDSDCDGDLLDLLFPDLDSDGTPDCVDVDADNDGFPNTADCNDFDPDTFPGAPEVADGVDQDCDGIIDETTEWYDDDGDGYAEVGGDCDDADPGISPVAAEVCDSVDQDCDTLVDEDTECSDDDDDGYSEVDGDCNDLDYSVGPDRIEIDGNGVDDDCDGVVDTGLEDLDADGYAPEGGDCDDDDPTVHPGAVEVCDDVDQNCDDIVDEDTECSDDDEDGYSELDGDCNDAEPDQSPDAVETVNGVDDDCDGLVDEGEGTDDADGDGWTEEMGDCDDEDAGVHPGAVELEDGLDQDCDGLVDDGLVDLDADGFTVDDGDCDDEDGWIHPDAHEFCNDLVDNDCDESTPDDCTEQVLVEPVVEDCGCSAGMSRSSGGLALLGFALLGLRRRRRGGSLRAVAGLLVLAAGLSGCSETVVARIWDHTALGPELSDVGSVPVGTSHAFKLELNHVSGSEIELFDAEVLNIEGAFFSFDGFGGDDLLEDGEEQLLAFTYRPLEPGFHWARIKVTSAAYGGELVAVVRGHSVPADVRVGPRVLEFGRVDAGDQVERNVTVWNDSDVALEFSDAVLSSDAFTVGAAFDVVEPWGAASATVQLVGVDGGALEETLTLEFADGRRGQTVILRANDCSNGLPQAYDADGDGFTSCATDCDDTDPDIHPGAPEVCDGADQDCDGVLDEGTTCSDDDGDGATEEEGDCNDQDPAIHPGAAELSDNGIDDDCDGQTDDESVDLDGDGYGPDGGDCDDLDPTSRPGAPEVVDDVDNDCDGIVDEGTGVYDDDGDGQSEAEGDCDDSDPDVFDGAVETADWTDQDCDGQVDEGTENGDDDGDGYTEVGGDCDDADPLISPAEAEVTGNGVDENCDGLAD